MVLSYSSNAFTRFSLLEAIERIQRLGFGGIEIMCDRPHLYPPDTDADSIAEIRNTLTRLGMKITNLNCFTLFAIGNTHLPSWIDEAPERRKQRIRHTLDCIHLASQIKCPYISVPPGGPLTHSDRRKAVSLFHQGLDEVIPAAENAGVTILIEPEPDLLIERTDQFLAFVKEIQSSSIGLNFDVGHFYCVGEDPSRAFEVLYPWARHIHIEDIAADRTHHHLIPGRGAIEFGKFFQTLAESGYDGDVCVELYTYAENPDMAGKESLEHLYPLLQHSGPGTR